MYVFDEKSEKLSLNYTQYLLLSEALLEAIFGRQYIPNLIIICLIISLNGIYRKNCKYWDRQI